MQQLLFEIILIILILDRLCVQIGIMMDDKPNEDGHYGREVECTWVGHAYKNFSIEGSKAASPVLKKDKKRRGRGVGGEGEGKGLKGQVTFLKLCLFKN